MELSADTADARTLDLNERAETEAGRRQEEMKEIGRGEGWF